MNSLIFEVHKANPAKEAVNLHQVYESVLKTSVIPFVTKII